MGLSRKIHRRCTCGCGGITNPGRRYINYHHGRGKIASEETRKKLSSALMGNQNGLGIECSEEKKRKISMSETGKIVSKKTRKKLSLLMIGQPSPMKGKHHSIKSRIKMSLSHAKCRPNYEYDESWLDKEYKDDLRKDYCEDKECIGDYKKLNNHHINLDPKNCKPKNIMTLCASCHQYLHWALFRMNERKQIEPRDFLTIIREDRIVYCHKKTRKTVTVRRNGSDTKASH